VTDDPVRTAVSDDQSGAPVARQRTVAQDQVGELLRTARESLGLPLAFLSRLDGTTQHLEVIESPLPLVYKDGNTQDQETSLCQAVIDKKLPSVVPDLRRYPEAMELPAARWPRHIRSYVSVPVTLSDGTLYGTFCAAGFTADKSLGKRDKSLMEVLARAAALLIEPGVQEGQRRGEIEDRIMPVIRAGGPVVVLQPIVDLATGLRIGAEALSRFPADWGKAPDVCFAEAHSVGLGHLLELLALERAAELLDRVGGYVSMNVSPGTLLTPECTELLGRLPARRILLELSEHDPVEDYPALVEALADLRAHGMKLAIDDVGAGFSSLRHIVLTSPDVIKLDRSIVDGVANDPVLSTLVRSLADFAHGCGARVVAEGVETEQDATTLTGLVDAGQGWFFGRPGPPEQLEPVLEPDAEPAAPRAAGDRSGARRPAARRPVAQPVGGPVTTGAPNDAA
jgi:EAL domain-containing protein (putative c-di-GMP-specific phosphodiesterase class I)